MEVKKLGEIIDDAIAWLARIERQVQKEPEESARQALFIQIECLTGAAATLGRIANEAGEIAEAYFRQEELKKTLARDWDLLGQEQAREVQSAKESVSEFQKAIDHHNHLQEVEEFQKAIDHHNQIPGIEATKTR